MQFEQGTNPARVKAANQSAILKTIYHCGPIKRSEIAGRLGLTLPTITTNVNSMMARGIVRETGSEPSSTRFAGRKAHLVDIVPGSRHFVGLEIQGARRAVCLLDYRGRALYARESLGEQRDYDRNMDLACEMIGRALSACGLGLESIAGIGACLPGLVDTRRGVLEVRPSYSWTHKDIRGDIAARIGYPGPIHVENNACARAYGAQLFRREALGEAQTFAYLFLSQGIACPLVLNTAIDFGSVVGAGEVYGEVALQTATLIKLTRALWIIPLAFVTMFIFRDRTGKISIPWFIFIFVLAMIVNTYVALPEALTSTLVWIARRGMVVTLFLIGASLSLGTIKQVGVKPLLLALALWVVISLTSLEVVLQTI